MLQSRLNDKTSRSPFFLADQERMNPLARVRADLDLTNFLSESDMDEEGYQSSRQVMNGDSEMPFVWCERYIMSFVSRITMILY